MLIEAGILFCLVAIIAAVVGRPEVVGPAQYIGISLVLFGVILIIAGLALPQSIGTHRSLLYPYPWNIP